MIYDKAQKKKITIRQLEMNKAAASTANLQWNLKVLPLSCAYLSRTV